ARQPPDADLEIRPDEAAAEDQEQEPRADADQGNTELDRDRRFAARGGQLRPHRRHDGGKGDDEEGVEELRLSCRD
ncbi:hypothetical protein LTR94_036794, partial [Friedmanniomyces endolithicus]